MSSTIKPLADRVVAAKEEAKAQTASGIYLPDTAKEKPAYAIVEAVGPDVKNIKVGDKILYDNGFDKSSELKYGNKEYIIVREKNILATV